MEKHGFAITNMYAFQGISSYMAFSSNLQARQMSHSDYEYNYADDDDEFDAGKRQSWTAEEDRMLKDMVKQFGARKWGTIATQFGNRNAKQCHQRFVGTSSFKRASAK